MPNPILTVNVPLPTVNAAIQALLMMKDSCDQHITVLQERGNDAVAAFNEANRLKQEAEQQNQQQEAA